MGASERAPSKEEAESRVVFLMAPAKGETMNVECFVIGGAEDTEVRLCTLGKEGVDELDATVFEEPTWVTAPNGGAMLLFVEFLLEPEEPE